MQRDSIDRRRFIRVEFPFTIHIYQPQQLAISAYTEDISEGGVKVTIKESLSIGAMVELEIYVREEPINCKGKIIWSRQRVSEYIEDEKFFDIGIAFHQITASDQEVVRHHVEAIQKMRRHSAGDS